MLQLLQPGSKHFSFAAFTLAIVVNVSLAGLIYGLTIGNSKQPIKDPLTINFRQFTDSTVEEQNNEPELEPIEEPQPITAALPPAVQATFDAPDISFNNSISLPAVSVPTFNVSPQLVDVTSAIQPEAVLAEPQIGLAKIRHKSNPEYPYKARRLKIEGYVLLHVLIDDAGRPKEIKVIEEQPRGYFAKASRKAVGRWEFEKTPAGTTEWKKVKLGFELN
ncbi:energy transducer TonB [Psychromonas algicola]|uniref:energy transducer TonB n=1 Tax=Psychromonas algicola TaxID=2555642 RepID=UPI0010689A4E|nr:energy transducer TonB [Psychromonas sp. RZ5]TEW52294.1 energy transducer TonB [Psychromonas sp. RZ5]